MENQTGIENQDSRLESIKDAYDKFMVEKENWDADLKSINNAVFDMSEFAISRIRNQINSEDNGWNVDSNGYFETECQYEDALTDLNELTELIVSALET